MRISDIPTMVGEMGLDWVAWRAAYTIGLKSGVLRRSFPSQDPATRLARLLKVPVSGLWPHLARLWSESPARFFVSDEIASYGSAVSGPANVLETADGLERGEFIFFNRWKASLGKTPDWFLNPALQVRYLRDRHWTQISDNSKELGDIKYVWEASRFAHVYSLARAYALNGNDRYPSLFWEHVDNWLDSNIPECGPHWRCAQEMSLRVMAWLFGLYAFRSSPASTPERVGRLICHIWHHMEHVERIHWYAARCVRNDHAMSEAAALFTVGTVLPFLPGAERWKEKGLRVFAHEASWQVYQDGTYIQHSMNYARAIAQMFTWVLRVAQVNAVNLPDVVPDRARRLLAFLTAMQDPVSGQLSKYGSNDGAMLAALSSCDYLDYRPALNALSLTLGHGRLYSPGPWDEEAVWFLGADTGDCASLKPHADRKPVELFSDGGYVMLRDQGTQGLLRCPAYRNRPFQADALHLDVFYHGCNVLVDPGTYSYNLQPPWEQYWAGTPSHNTITVDGQDQMKRASRFMWLHWTQARLLRCEQVGDTRWFEGEHDGYSPVVHRRRVFLRDQVYMVIDDLQGSATEHSYRLHWLVNDLDLRPDNVGAEIRLPVADQGTLRLEVWSPDLCVVDWVRADEQEPRGWQSLYYGEKSPAWSLTVSTSGRTGRFVTLLGPKDKVARMLPLSPTRLADLIAEWTGQQTEDL